MTGSLAALHREGGKSLTFLVILHHPSQINRADDVDVVQNEWPRLITKEISGLLQATAGVEQNLFARDFDAHAEIIVLLQILQNHVGKVMRIDDHFDDSKSPQAEESDFQ